MKGSSEISDEKLHSPDKSKISKDKSTLNKNRNSLSTDGLESPTALSSATSSGEVLHDISFGFDSNYPESGVKPSQKPVDNSSMINQSSAQSEPVPVGLVFGAFNSPVNYHPQGMEQERNQVRLLYHHDTLYLFM